jgi:hypothetical protein
MPSIHLEKSIIVHRSMAEIPEFFNNPKSLTAWDVSVAKVALTCHGPLRVGYTFDTIGPARNGRPGKRSSYRVVKLEPQENDVELTNSKIFKRAVWGFRFDPIAEDTRITCSIDLRVKSRFFFIGWLLKLNKQALNTDLERLKKAIESYGE